MIRALDAPLAATTDESREDHTQRAPFPLTNSGGIALLPSPSFETGGLCTTDEKKIKSVGLTTRLYPHSDVITEKRADESAHATVIKDRARVVVVSDVKRII